MKKALIFGFYFTMTVLLTMSVSLAYLDPSSMTFVIQVVAGIVIAVGTVFGFYFKRIRRYFRNKKKAKENLEETVVTPVSTDENDDASKMLSKD
ncbi:MAG: hypothetical protein HFJ85_02500 [Oscillospiraceae bacterium]|nr:hypothetical protein [Oscillospiraceae bacterium]